MKYESVHTLSVTSSADSAVDVARGPCLFAVLQADQPLLPSSRHALAGIAEVSIGRASERASLCGWASVGDSLTLALPDRWASSRHAAIVRDGDGFQIVDRGSKNGVFRNGERVTLAHLVDGDVLEIGHTFLLFRSEVGLAGPPNVSSAAVGKQLPCFATLSLPLAARFDGLASVAQAAIPVRISGETGTGKELVARAIHTLSGRSGPFVGVNCGALASNLVESELFGFRKGAFSGARDDHLGLVRAASGGTLFLDEIGELPLAAQAALLRVLQEHEVLPVGATRPIPVDLRVVAATNRDLEDDVRRGVFRADLLGRIGGFDVRLPPLRERREDLGILLRACIAAEAVGGADRVALSNAAARRLFSYDWPRNIRELRLRLAAGLALAQGGLVGLEHLFEDQREGAPKRASSARMATAPPIASLRVTERPPPMGDEEPFDEAALSPDDRARREELLGLLAEHRGNISAVARAMGKARMQIQRWIRRYRIAVRP